MTLYSAIVATDAEGNLEAVERSLEQLKASGGELIKVLACGVCYSDVVIAEGGYGNPYPLVLGHEVVGTHESLGNVLVYAPWGCRKSDCRECSSGLEMICSEGHDAGVVDDGGYAQYMTVPSVDYLLPIGDRDPLKTAPLACAGLTAYRAVKRALPFLKNEESSALIIGAGGVGQYVIQILNILSECSIAVEEQNLAKRTIAQILGAEIVSESSAVNSSFDVIIDCVGTNQSFTESLKRIRPGGSVFVAGFGHGRVQFGIGTHSSEASISSTIMGSLQELRELIVFSDENPLEIRLEVLPLEDAVLSHQKLKAGTAEGRIVLLP